MKPENSPNIGIKKAIEYVKKQEDMLTKSKETPIEIEFEGGLSESQKAKKHIVCFVGMPGAGKTTQIEALQGYTGAPVFHLAKVAKTLNLEKDGVQVPVADLMEEKRKMGELIEGLDDLFLAEVANSKQGIAILDGFPRSPDQAAHLLAYAAKNRWHIDVVYLESDVHHAWRHQVRRAKNSNENVDWERFDGKIDRAIRKDIPAVQALKSAGVPITELDATRDKKDLKGEIRESLGFSYENLPWEKNILEYGKIASQRSGVQLWFGAGMLYRPFWNGKFGPFQESTDKDIFVMRKEDIESVQKVLEEIAPDIRWSVHSRAEESEAHFGHTPTTLEEGITHAPMNFRKGGVRMGPDGKMEVLLSPIVEADLRNGILRLDDSVLASIDQAKREEYINDAMRRMHKTLREYPGLQFADTTLAEKYAQVTGSAHAPKELITRWEEIQDEIWETETGGRARWNPDSINIEQENLMNELVSFYRTVDKSPSAPPRPKKSIMPVLIEDLRVRNITDKVQPPEGYESWLQYVIREATDAEFCEWLLNQTRSRQPIGGRDQDLSGILTFSREKEQEIGVQTQEQKRSHLGFTLDQHLLESALQLHTDELEELLKSFPVIPLQFRDVRASLRMGMLYHDIGKLYNVHTPGSHEGVGAKMWNRLKPSWISDEQASLAEWIIRTHDVFGRLARGITEKENKSLEDNSFNPMATPSYQGALDPHEALGELERLGYPRDLVIALHKIAWTADVSSVSALRWILPAADILEKIVIQETKK